MSFSDAYRASLAAACPRSKMAEDSAGSDRGRDGR
jgi:hypothetical protein